MLYRLTYEDADIDEIKHILVRANSEKEAREMTIEVVPNTEKERWNGDWIKCEEIKEEGEKKVILVSWR